MNLYKSLKRILSIPKRNTDDGNITPVESNHWLWGSGDVILFGGGDAIRLHHNGNDYDCEIRP